MCPPEAMFSTAMSGRRCESASACVRQLVGSRPEGKPAERHSVLLGIVKLLRLLSDNEETILNGLGNVLLLVSDAYWCV